jgi:prepilin-type N-terminal cleavage/methylation domain-containing protein
MKRAHDGRLGFTLIEVLAVIVILGILMIVLLPRLTGTLEVAKARETGVWIASIDAAAKEYEGRFGDFPPSHFPDKWGASPNQTNLGGEALVVSLWSSEWSGVALAEDKFGNTDEDEAKKALTRFPDKRLQELVDPWGNPIAYFHHRDYGRADVYLVKDAETGEIAERQAKAWMNPTTKTWANSTTFQLVSAGEDSQFGTSDDVTNFKRE